MAAAAVVVAAAAAARPLLLLPLVVLLLLSLSLYVQFKTVLRKSAKLKGKKEKSKEKTLACDINILES
jgi:hypothetical protein